MYEALEAEAEAAEMSLSEYVRSILRERPNTTGEYEQNTQEHTTEYDERIQALEARVDDLERQVEQSDSGTVFSPPEPQGSRPRNHLPERDLTDSSVPPGELAVQWLRELGEPAGRAEIVNAVYPESAEIKPESWWTRHARPALEEAGAEYTRNVGWKI